MELPAAKRRVARDIFKFVPDLDSVRFVESFDEQGKGCRRGAATTAACSPGSR